MNKLNGRASISSDDCLDAELQKVEDTLTTLRPRRMKKRERKKKKEKENSEKRSEKKKKKKMIMLKIMSQSSHYF